MIFNIITLMILGAPHGPNHDCLFVTVHDTIYYKEFHCRSDTNVTDYRYIIQNDQDKRPFVLKGDKKYYLNQTDSLGKYGDVIEGFKEEYSSTIYFDKYDWTPGSYMVLFIDEKGNLNEIGFEVPFATLSLNCDIVNAFIEYTNNMKFKPTTINDIDFPTVIRVFFSFHHDSWFPDKRKNR